MAHRIMIDGTEYGVMGGICLVNGTSYKIKRGTALVDGTTKSIDFPPVVKTIPPGRIKGDVDGDGDLTNNDSALINQYMVHVVELDELQKLCADVNGDGSIGTSDANLVILMITGRFKIGTYSSDVFGNWNVNENYETEEAQFYIVIEDADAVEGATITFYGDETDRVTNTQMSNGILKVYVTIPPINTMEYTIE